MAGLGRRSHYRKHITDSVLNTCPEPGEGERIAKVVGTRGSNQFEIILPDTKSTCRGTVASTDSYTKSDSGEKARQQWGQQPQPQPQPQPQSHHQPPIAASARTSKLAILPTKYRKLVWLKRNDFVIVRCGQDDDEDAPSSENGKEGNMMDHQAPSGVEEKVDEATSRGTAAVISGIRYEISHILYKYQVKHLQRKGLWPDDDPLFSGEGDAVGSGAAMANDSRATNQSDGEEQAGKDHDNYDDGEGGNDDGIVYDADDLLFVNTNKISTLLIDSESESDSDSDAGSGA